MMLRSIIGESRNLNKQLNHFANRLNLHVVKRNTEKLSNKLTVQSKKWKRSVAIMIPNNMRSADSSSYFVKLMDAFHIMNNARKVFEWGAGVDHVSYQITIFLNLSNVFTYGRIRYKKKLKRELGIPSKNELDGMINDNRHMTELIAMDEQVSNKKYITRAFTGEHSELLFFLENCVNDARK